MKKSILIIDDDPFVGQALKKVLQEAGYNAVASHEGGDGIARLESGQFDLLLLDLNLAGLSGFDILDRTRIRHPALGVVVLTAFADQCEPGSLDGVDSLFVKPPDVPALLSVIDQLLSGPEPRGVRHAGVGVPPRRRSPRNQLTMPGIFPAKRPD